MSTLLGWLAAVAGPTVVLYLIYPPRPGENNDVPFWLGVVLIAYIWSVTMWASVHFLGRRLA